MTSLHLMSMRADVQRVSTETTTDPFGQVEVSGTLETVETAVGCVIWNAKEDVIVNERRYARFAVWQGIMDERSTVKVGDTLANIDTPAGANIFPAEERRDSHGGDLQFSLRVLRAVLVPGHHIGLTLESVGGAGG